MTYLACCMELHIKLSTVSLWQQAEFIPVHVLLLALEAS